MYAELQTTSNFTFLTGASHPEELVLAAAALGHAAVAITDHNTLAGVVRAHTAAKEAGIRLVVGARLRLQNGPDLLCLPTDRAAYGRLSQLITLGRRRAPKGQCHLTLDDAVAHAEGQILIALAPEPLADGRADPDPDLAAFAADLRALRGRLSGDLYLAGQWLFRGDDAKRLHRLAQIAEVAGTPLVATNDAHAHTPDRRRVQDVLTCIREGCTIADAGWRLAVNAERHLKPPGEMARLFKGYEDAVARSVAIAERCRFSLDELRYEYPDEIVVPGETPQATLERLTREGAAHRYPGGVTDAVRHQLAYELDLIRQMDYAPYFLTVQDIVRYARSRGILCQGRGSAANSAVCYVLGITAVDPARADLLFERFISTARNEPPDIDVDFEHERREEVIQYIYQKYGRERAGLAATVIRYRARGALRDVGKAMGLSVDTLDRLSKTVWGWGKEAVDEKHLLQAGLDPSDPSIRLVLEMAGEILGFPRHLSQHVGGFVIARGRLDELAPIENASMADRTVIQWDKDDLDALGMLKVDVLALGMLSCVRRGFDLIARHYDRALDLASVPAEDPAVYDMLCRADSLGVFQVESRAQMTMLPRLKPRTFYDLVIEVAIVRPGPIQGDMVHPYLRRRNGEEQVEYPSEDLKRVLHKTLGVPLFQEQAMRIAIEAAGFTPSEADRLRRAMATFKKHGDVHKFYDKMVNGMIERGYDPDFAQRCFKQIEGFGTYGFPESHAASFALLVYISAWIKCHHPDVFCAALLNSQPMGFYAPAQIVRDAREHGVEVLAPDVNFSDWDSTLEPLPPDGDGRPRHAVRLGLRLVKGLSAEAAAALVAERQRGGLYADPRAIWRRAGLGPGTLETLAKGDCYRSLHLDRRQASWAVKALGPQPLPLFAHMEHEADEPAVALPDMPMGEHVVQDYRHLTLTLKTHPMALLRAGLARDGFAPTERLAAVRHGRRVAVAGLVLVRQRPGSAKGVIFITLEDEAGVANLVMLPPVFETFRKEVLAGRLLGAHGRVEKAGTVIHLKVERLVDLSDRLALLREGAGRDSAEPFDTLARADEVRRPTNDQRLEKAEQTARERRRRDVDLQKARSFR